MKQLVTIVAVVLFCTAMGVMGASRNIDKGESQRIAMYGDTSTAPTYIAVRIKDAATGEFKNLVVENLDFAMFLADKDGVPRKDLPSFIRRHYIQFMLANEDQAIEIGLSEFESLLAKRLGTLSEARDYLENASFAEPLTLKTLELASEDQLLDKYFEFDKSQGYGKVREDLPKEETLVLHSPAFIAMLIKLGFVVRRGDVVPLLFISKPN